ncbi:MAG: hypothetical protein LBV14_13535 [Acidovorax sp.]|jgi:hypothetical protein|nr:hypothetical protein [Acidovorax sp.]
MFEKTTHTAGTVLCTILLGIPLGWLAWVCLSNMDWLLALVVFIPCALLFICLFGPAVVIVSLLGGFIAGGVAVLFSSASRAHRGKKHVR